MPKSHIHDVVIHGCRPLARHLQEARLADVGFASDDLAMLSATDGTGGVGAMLRIRGLGKVIEDLMKPS